MPCSRASTTNGRRHLRRSFSSRVPGGARRFSDRAAELHERLIAARRACVDPQPPFIEQATLADFIGEGHFARHLRRMRAVYRERLEALVEGAARFCGETLRLRSPAPACTPSPISPRPTRSGSSRKAVRRGIELMPLSAYTFAKKRGRQGGGALVLGFGAAPPAALTRGMQNVSQCHRSRASESS